MFETILGVNNDGTREPGGQTRSRVKAGPLEAHYGRIGIAAVAAALVASRPDNQAKAAEIPATGVATGVKREHADI